MHTHAQSEAQHKLSHILKLPSLALLTLNVPCSVIQSVPEGAAARVLRVIDARLGPGSAARLRYESVLAGVETVPGRIDTRLAHDSSVRLRSGLI
jgi:hypothetical protein